MESEHNQELLNCNKHQHRQETSITCTQTTSFISTQAAISGCASPPLGLAIGGISLSVLLSTPQYFKLGLLVPKKSTIFPPFFFLEVLQAQEGSLNNIQFKMRNEVTVCIC